MSKGNGFFSGLKKSTKITLVSCGCFIALTAVILSFFVMFPFTPDEKVMGFGRESIFKQDTEAATVAPVTTTVNDDILIASNTYTTTTVKRTTAKKYTTHKITSGSGFFMDQRIPTGVYPNEYYTPTTTTTAIGGGTGEIPTSPNGEALIPPEGGEGTEIPTEGNAGAGSEVPTEGNAGAGAGAETPAPVEGDAAPQTAE